jgi:hypothetical protein
MIRGNETSPNTNLSGWRLNQSLGLVLGQELSFRRYSTLYSVYGLGCRGLEMSLFSSFWYLSLATLRIEGNRFAILDQMKDFLARGSDKSLRSLPWLSRAIDPLGRI